MGKAEHVVELGAEIWPLVAPRLAGQPPELQSAVLADLAARWLAGHVCPGDRKATKRLRRKLLAQYVQLVHDLVEPNAKQAGTWFA